ncbi:MAG: hypothetical protein IIA14_08420 [SAR324 cluster bacterium]|nr:hypothetical protein [SAR324 cluster bacterium]
MHLSTQERVAGDAEGKVVRLYKVLFMERFLGQDLAATVTGVSRRGLFLAVRDHFAEGLLPLELLSGDRYRFDAERGALIGRGQGRRIAVGERLTAQLVRADRLVQELEFGLTRWGWEED